MTEKERQTKLKKLKKKLAGMYEEIAELANSSRAVQANVREAIDICEGEIHYYENMVMDSKGLEVLLKSSAGKEKTFTVVENNADPFNGIISSSSDVGKKLKKLKVGAEIQIAKDKYKVMSKKEVDL
jgi:transcription elongation GreA/GreB family factor